METDTSCWTCFKYRSRTKITTTQQTNSCSKSTIKTLKKGVKYVQS